MMPKMVLLVVSLLFAWMPTPTLSAITNLVAVATGPLQYRLSWDDDAETPQTYKVLVRDSASRTSYYVTGVTAKEFLVDDAGQAQLLANGAGDRLVVDRTTDMTIQVTGEADLEADDDNAMVSSTVGNAQDIMAPPEYMIICEYDDETSVDDSGRAAPGGCKNPKELGKVVMWYAEPTDYGYRDDTHLEMVYGWKYEWSTDETFTTNVFEDTCIKRVYETGATDLLVENGDVCNSKWNSAQIPGSGMIQGLHYIRMAALFKYGNVGALNTGLFTEAIVVERGEYPTRQVTFKATLMMQLSSFTTNEQNIYLEGVANALNVPRSDVSIGNIDEIDGVKIEVNTIAEVKELLADSVESNGGWDSRDTWKTICE